MARTPIEGMLMCPGQQAQQGHAWLGGLWRGCAWRGLHEIFQGVSGCCWGCCRGAVGRRGILRRRSCCRRRSCGATVMSGDSVLDEALVMLAACVVSPTHLRVPQAPRGVPMSPR